MSEEKKKHLDKKESKSLSRQQLRELEAKEKTKFQIVLDWIIMFLPILCGVIAILEYELIPDGRKNKNPNTYLGVLLVFIAMYVLYLGIAFAKKICRSQECIDKLRYRAPLFSALFLLLAAYDYMTLKTGILTQPFIPCMNSILNIAWEDKAWLKFRDTMKNMVSMQHILKVNL